MKPPVYIPTRGRIELLRKALPHWVEKAEYVTLVVDRQERSKHHRLLNELELEDDVLVMPLQRGKGIGWIRRQVLRDARQTGEFVFVFADDDLYPTTEVESLADLVIDADIVGAGASCSFHGLLLGNNEILKTGEKFPIAGGFGHRLVAINTENAEAVGGYPVWLDALGEDAELQRKGIAAGAAWWLDTSVRFTSTSKRYTPGGLAAQFPKSRTRREEKCQRAMAAEWPKYMKPPPSPYRCSWRKMMDDYLPDWRDDVPKKVRRLGYGAD